MNITPSERPMRRPPLPEWNGSALAETFAAASAAHPWTLGYRSFNDDSVTSIATLEGHIPDGLRGTLYRNGPARHERGGRRYGHRWDGDGLVQRYSIGLEVAHIARYVQTEKYIDEARAGRLLYSAFGTAIAHATPTPQAIERSNPANISVLPFAGELLALWEAGAPYRLDPQTLATLGRVDWHDSTGQGRPFSAHPKRASDGTLWNFGIEPLADRLTLYRFAPGSREPVMSSFHVDHIAPAHDFAVTDHFVVLLLPSISVDCERLRAGVAFGQACQWAPSEGMRLLLIAKTDGALREYRLPAGVLFHVANAWEDRDTVFVDYMRSANPLSLLAGWTIMAGQYRHRAGAALTRVRIDTASDGASQHALVDHDAEFPVIAAGDAGRPYRQLLCTERSAHVPDDVPGYDQVTLIDVHRGERRGFRFGERWMVEEHVIAVDPATGRPRWAIGTALDLASERTALSIFELDAIEAGPVARAYLNYATPLGLHGCYIATA